MDDSRCPGPLGNLPGRTRARMRSNDGPPPCSGGPSPASRRRCGLAGRRATRTSRHRRPGPPLPTPPPPGAASSGHRDCALLSTPAAPEAAAAAACDDGQIFLPEEEEEEEEDAQDKGSHIPGSIPPPARPSVEPEAGREQQPGTRLASAPLCPAAASRPHPPPPAFTCQPRPGSGAALSRAPGAERPAARPAFRIRHGGASTHTLSLSLPQRSSRE